MARGAIRRHIDGITGALQTACQEIRNPFFVFDDQNPHII